MSASIQRLTTPAIEALANVSPARAVGAAIILIVAADPIGFRDRLFGTIDRLIDARYSVIVDSKRRTVIVGTELA